MLDKINVTPIFEGHLQTLRDNGFRAEPSVRDRILFFGIPCAIGLAVVSVGFRFRTDAVNGFLNVFSVLTGLLLNLLVLVLSLSTVKSPGHVAAGRRMSLIREIFANVCFAVLVAIAVLCVALVALSYLRSDARATTGYCTTFLLPALTSNFVLTLLMVVKRMYSLISKEFQYDSSEPPQQSRAA